MYYAACKVEFQNIQSVVLTVDVFQFLSCFLYYKNIVKLYINNHVYFTNTMP